MGYILTTLLSVDLQIKRFCTNLQPFYRCTNYSFLTFVVLVHQYAIYCGNSENMYDEMSRMLHSCWECSVNTLVLPVRDFHTKQSFSGFGTRWNHACKYEYAKNKYVLRRYYCNWFKQNSVLIVRTWNEIV